MAVIVAGQLRNGTTFEMEGQVYKVLEFQHVKVARGPAVIRTKLKNIIAGNIIDKTFNPSDKVDGATIEVREMMYLYNDGDNYHFMDNDTYEQISLPFETVEHAIKYIKENMNIKVISYKGNIYDVEPPMFVELEVKYTEPGFAGNTVTTSEKNATMENDLLVSVPLFIETGDVLKIDTRTNTYIERVKKV